MNFIYRDYFIWIWGLVTLGVGIFMILKGSKILEDNKRNAWDILYLNSFLATLLLFLIGFIADDIIIRKNIVVSLAIVATGVQLTAVLMSQKNQKETKSSTDVKQSPTETDQ